MGASVGDGPLPAGYDHVEERARVGGVEEFARARDGLFAWALQRHARVAVHPPDARPVPGTTVVLRLGAGPLHVTAPCRVVWAVDEPGRAGFAYGTLPGHPERGEESFVLHRTAEGTLLVVRAFSRPDRWYSRLGAPVSGLVQRRVTARYLSALHRSANS
ncbi:hypothetical protein BJF78_06345 [Pseudonocardia sp. CNS-139]|nr:hypothetical protein BJF78_06345 [Pseudonocardia sp. CNS-139]